MSAPEGGPTPLGPSEIDDLVWSVEAAEEFLRRAASEEGMVKWAVFALHALVQSACVAALHHQRGHDYGELDRDGRRDWDRFYAEDRAPDRAIPHGDRLAGFMTLYKRVCSTIEMRRSAPLVPEPQEVAAIERLNDLRNAFAHRSPSGWGTSPARLAEAAQAAAAAVAHLAGPRAAFAHHLDTDAHRRIGGALERIVDTAASLREGSP